MVKFGHKPMRPNKTIYSIRSSSNNNKSNKTKETTTTKLSTTVSWKYELNTHGMARVVITSAILCPISFSFPEISCTPSILKNKVVLDSDTVSKT